MKLVERETALVSSAVSYLRARGAVAWRNQAGKAFGAHKGKAWAMTLGAPGLPDVFAVFGPPLRVLAVECKRPGGRLRRTQVVKLEELRRRGVQVVILTDIADLEAAVREL